MATKKRVPERYLLPTKREKDEYMAKQDAELARLRAECEELRGSVKSKQNCLDAALEGWNKANARIERLRAECEALRAALRPFAVAMSGYDGKCLKYDSDECEVAVFMDYETPHCFDTAGEALTLGDLRRAAAALKDEP